MDINEVTQKVITNTISLNNDVALGVTSRSGNSSLLLSSDVMSTVNLVKCFTFAPVLAHQKEQ